MAPALLDNIVYDEIAAGQTAAKIRRQHLRNDSNPSEVSDEQLRKYHRMSQKLAVQLIVKLVDTSSLSLHPQGVLPHLQLLSVLRFLASGSYQTGLGHDYNLTMS